MPNVWPPGLPQSPTPRSWSERGEKNYIESEPGVGAPVRRMIQTSAGALASGTFMLTKIQLVSLFLPFYETDLRFGTLSYQWIHPIRGGLFYWRMEEEPSYTAITLDAYELSLSLRRLA